MPDYSLQRLSNDHSLRALKLGDEAFAPLKRFLSQDARKYEDFSLVRTYVVAEGNVVRGYVSVVCGEVSAKIETGDGIKFPYNYPAIKIARLAIDHRHDRAGLGRTLVKLAIGIGKEAICPSVGCRFVVVDAKRESVKFYEKCGFTLLASPDNQKNDHPMMFLDLLRA